LRARLLRTGHAKPQEIEADTDLVVFALQMPVKDWADVRRAYEVHKVAASQVAWAKRVLKGTAAGLLYDILKERDAEIRRLRRRLARHEPVDKPEDDDVDLPDAA
jgi:hypothetical protein